MAINDRIEELEKLMAKLEEAEKPKPNKKLERKLKRLSKKKASENWATVVSINENNDINLDTVKIEDQVQVTDGVPRLAGPKDILRFKGKPVIIQPSWSVKPFSPSKHWDESLKDGSNSAGFRLLLAKIKEGELKKKMKIGLGVGIIILIVVGVVLYGVFGGG